MCLFQKAAASACYVIPLHQSIVNTIYFCLPSFLVTELTAAAAAVTFKSKSTLVYNRITIVCLVFGTCRNESATTKNDWRSTFRTCRIWHKNLTVVLFSVRVTILRRWKMFLFSVCAKIQKWLRCKYRTKQNLYSFNFQSYTSTNVSIGAGIQLNPETRTGLSCRTFYDHATDLTCSWS